MRIFLDTKDLIEVIERGQPVPIEELDSFLRRNNGKLVLSYGVILEFAAPLIHGADLLRMRSLLQKIESLPVVYMREGIIFFKEIQAALAAFRGGATPQKIDVYVPRFDYACHILNEAPPSGRYVGLRLDEIVFMLFRSDPGLFQNAGKYAEGLRLQFVTDRRVPKQARKTLRENFAESLKGYFHHWPKLGSLNDEELKEFANWVFDNPSVCPALRINYGLYHQMLDNVRDIPADTDIPDFGHILGLPYVEAATLDRRMFGYVASVLKSLKRRHENFRPTFDLYRNLAELLAVHCESTLQNLRGEPPI